MKQIGVKVDSEAQVGDSMNKIIQKDELLEYLNKDCTVHIISKYGEADFTEYINLTKLLQDSIIVVDSEEKDIKVDNCLQDNADSICENTNNKSTSNSKRKQKPIDKGKIIALHNAGWSVTKIADEMKCAVSTVYKIIKMKS